MHALQRFSLGLSLLTAIALAATATPAFAQYTQANTVIITDGSNPSAEDDFPAEIDTREGSISLGIQAASDKITGGEAEHVYVIIIAKNPVAPWDGVISIAPDESISVQGWPDDAPWDVVVQPDATEGGQPVLTLDTVPDTVVISSLTLRGATGAPGVLIKGDTGSPTIERCYILDNEEHGVQRTGEASVNLVNCCIYRNGGDGVSIESSVDTSTSTVTHCTILENGGSGVHASNFGQVEVTNNLIYKNGQGDVLEEFPLGATVIPPWTRSPNSEWEWGEPSGAGVPSAPDAGATGDNALAVNLNGDYTVAPALETIFQTQPSDTRTGTISFPEDIIIGDVNVILTSNHPEPERLAVSLESPDGTVVLLYVAGDFASGQVLDKIQFNDEGADPIAGATLALEGVYTPQNPLSGFDNTVSQGNWLLHVDDTSLVSPTDITFQLELHEKHVLETDVLDFSADPEVRLGFQRYLNMPQHTGAGIEVSNDGGITWTSVWDMPSTGVDDTGWTAFEVDISAQAAGHNNVQVRWGYHAENALVAPPQSGWYIDDIVFRGAASPNVGGLVAEGSDALVTALSNYVYLNESQEYLGVDNANDVMPVSGNEDPRFLSSAAWAGKLEGVASPLNGLAVPKSVLRDFEGDTRSASTPDIGADEIGGPAIGSWSVCFVSPNPIGRLNAGQIQIEVRYSGSLNATTGIFIVPQYGDLLTDRIPFTIQEGGNGFYRATNTNAIRTSLTNGTDTPGAGDVIVDGHGVVYLQASGGGIVGSDYIGSEAEKGRHVLIDTIPPRLVQVFNGLDISAAQMVIDNSGSEYRGASHVPWSWPIFPGSGANIFAAAADAIQLTATPTTPAEQEDPKIFFNTGSAANYYPAVPLNISVTAAFIDPTVGEVFPDTGLGTPQVAGLGTGIAPDHDAQTLIAGIAADGSPLPARWILDDATAFASLQANIEGIGGAGLNGGYFGTDIAGSRDAAFFWNFKDVTDVPGIPYDRVVSGDPLHLEGQFAAVDRAGNETPLDLRGPPLHIWWITGPDIRSTMTATFDASSLYPTVSWGYSPSYNPGIVSDQPRVQYAYQVYGYNPETGLYDPLTNWLAGDTTTLDPASFRALQDDLRATGDSLLDRELIVAAYAIDIAGNVEQVPVSGSNVELNYIGDSVEQIAADEGGDNWVHVVIPAEGTDIDTTLTANIRYVNNVNPALSRDLGQAAIVEYPPGPDTFIVAEFDVTILPPDPNSAFDTESVYYELSANGVRVTEVGDFELGDYEPADGKRRVRITLPDPTYAPPGLGNPDAVVNYVFHAYTVLQGGTVDATPAQYHFKVVPGTVQDYLESSMGGKPVIVFETD